MVAPGFGAPGRPTVGEAGFCKGAVFNAMVGAPPGIPLVVFNLIVGAGAGRAVGGPAVLRGIVGAGAGALEVAGSVGAKTGALVAVGTAGAGGAGAAGTVAAAGGTASVGVGGLGMIGPVGGATGAGATGASLALRVTRTVSFLRGILDVCFDGVFLSSLMCVGLMVCVRERKTNIGEFVKHGNSFFVRFYEILAFTMFSGNLGTVDSRVY